MDKKNKRSSKSRTVKDSGRKEPQKRTAADKRRLSHRGRKSPSRSASVSAVSYASPSGSSDKPDRPMQRKREKASGSSGVRSTLDNIAAAMASMTSAIAGIAKGGSSGTVPEKVKEKKAKALDSLPDVRLPSLDNGDDCPLMKATIPTAITPAAARLIIHDIFGASGDPGHPEELEGYQRRVAKSAGKNAVTSISKALGLADEDGLTRVWDHVRWIYDGILEGSFIEAS